MPGLNSATCGDNYTNAATLSDVWNSRGGWFQITGQSAYVEMQYGRLGSPFWTTEQLLGSGAVAFVPTNCTGVRFRNATAGLVATVTAYIAEGDEPPLSILSTGNTAVLTSSLNFQHNDVAVATEPTVDLEDSATITWTVVDDAVNTRVKVTPSVVGGATYNATVTAPGAVTGTTLKMQGLAGSITPIGTRVMFMIRGMISVSASTAKASLRYGTGAAPANGDAATGTQIGLDYSQINATSTGNGVPVDLYGIVTGLSAGTPYWFDAAIAGFTGGGTVATLAQVTLTAFEP